MWPLRSYRHDGSKPPAAGVPPGILAIMKSAQDQAAVAEFARANGWGVTIAKTLDEASSAISARANTALVVLDRDVAESDWQSAVRGLVQYRPAPCVILASNVMDEYLFEEIVRQGGFDIVAKPIRPDELRRIGGLALTFWKSRAGLGESY